MELIGNVFYNRELDNKINSFRYPVQVVPEKIHKHKKFVRGLVLKNNYYSDFFGSIKNKIQDMGLKEIFDNSDISIEGIYKKFEFSIAEVGILGEYWNSKKEIHYFKMDDEYEEIVKIHERFHSIHHLTPNDNNEEWKDFGQTPTFYMELLAQLFTYIYIRDVKPSLLDDFHRLCKEQSFEYNSWMIFQDYDLNKAIKLYWEIRNRLTNRLSLGVLESINSCNEINKAMNNEINNVLSEEISFICKNPLVFVSETDIHAMIYRKLRGIQSLNLLYDTNCTIGRNYKGLPSNNKYKTYLVHKEYGINGMSKSRCDLVILNPDNIRNIDDPINLKTKNGWIKPDYMFEFGTEKCAQSDVVFEKHLKNDLRKLQQCNKKGFLIHIQRNFCQKYVGKNKPKIKKYASKIKSVISNQSISKAIKSKRISILIIIVDIGSGKRNLISKIGIYENGSFVRININELENKIAIMLN